MKTFDQKRAELEKAKEDAYIEAQALYDKIDREYKAKIKDIDSDLEALSRAEFLLSDKDSENEQNGQPFSVKGSMSVREGLLKVLKEENRPLHLDEIMKALQIIGIESDRGTVRARIAKSVQSKEIQQVDKAVYAIRV